MLYTQLSAYRGTEAIWLFHIHALALQVSRWLTGTEKEVGVIHPED